MYKHAFEFADGDAECLRIAVTYGQELGEPIFDPNWYAAYMKSCGRFTDETPEVVDALFEFQQALLGVVVGDNKVIYAPHVAAAFATLPIVATNAQLIVSAV